MAMTCLSNRIATALCVIAVAATGCGGNVNEDTTSAGSGGATTTATGGAGGAGTIATGSGGDGGGGAGGAGTGGSGGMAPPIPHPDCGDTSGILASAPWPMPGFCPTRHGRSPFLGPEFPEPGPVWEKSVGAMPPAVAAGGKLFVAASEMPGVGAVFEVPNSDPSQGWQVSTTGSVTAPPTLGADGTLYVPTETGALHAISSKGKLLWTFLSAGSSAKSPVIGADGTIYFATSTHLSAITKDGVEKWSAAVQGASAAAIGFDGRIYVGSMENALHVFDVDGNEQIHVDLEGPAEAPSIGADGTVYLFAGASLHAIDPSGTLLWSYPAGTGRSLAIGVDGTIVIVTLNGDVMGISPTGDLVWQHGFSYGAPTIDAAGTIYVSSSHWITAILPDGTEKWMPLVDGVLPIEGAIPIGENGTIYPTSYNGVFTLRYP